MIEGTILKDINDLTIHDPIDKYLKFKDVRNAAIEIAKWLNNKKMSYIGLQMMFRFKTSEIRPLFKDEKDYDGR